jgi:hypothetical protein
MSDSERRSSVTVENLLHLKRVERPPAEFWAEFDRQLRGKQLAAIVDASVGWRRWFGIRSLVRVAVPLGVAAVLALAVDSWRRVSSTPASFSQATLASVAFSGAQLDSSQRGKMESSEVAVGSRDMRALSLSSEMLSPAESAEVRSSVAAELTAVRADTRREVAVERESPSARSIAANFAAVLGADPGLIKIIEHVSNLDIRPAASRTLAEPLAQIATPQDNRRARLLAYSVSSDPHAPDSSDAVRSRERLTRRLSDDALYDSISRLGLTGQSVSIKF